MATPQKEGLPDIQGSFSGVGQQFSNTPNSLSGAFYRVNTVNQPAGGVPVKNDGEKDDVFGFKASNYNSGTTVYGKSSGVTPPNMAVYAYIYAGKIVQ